MAAAAAECCSSSRRPSSMSATVFMLGRKFRSVERHRPSMWHTCAQENAGTCTRKRYTKKVRTQKKVREKGTTRRAGTIQQETRRKEEGKGETAVKLSRGRQQKNGHRKHKGFQFPVYNRRGGSDQGFLECIYTCLPRISNSATNIDTPENLFFL